MSRDVILFLAANPSGTTQLALAEECAAIERELRITAGRDDFDFRSKWAVSVDDMMRHLNELQPSIIHFSGHGGGDLDARADDAPRPHRDVEAAKRGGIYLQDEHRQPQHVNERALTRMISSAAPSARVVVLNACFSDAAAEALRAVVDCVVGMRGAISDDAARVFAVGFYRALGHRRSVGTAVEQAIAALAALRLPDENLPVCMTREGIDANQVRLSSIALLGPGAGSLQPRVPRSRKRAVALGFSGLTSLILSALYLSGILSVSEKPVDVDAPLPASLEKLPMKAADSPQKRLEIVSIELPPIIEMSHDMEERTDPWYPRLDIKLRNPTPEVAYIKTLRVTIKQDHRIRYSNCYKGYDFMARSAGYRLYVEHIDTMPSIREISLSQVVRANDVDRFSIEMSLPWRRAYEMEFTLLYDGDDKALSSGPVVLATNSKGCGCFPNEKAWHFRAAELRDTRLRDDFKADMKSIRTLMHVRGLRSAYFQDLQRCIWRDAAGLGL